MTPSPQAIQTRSPALTRRQRRGCNNTLIHIVLLACAAVMFIPLAWTLSTSLKDVSEIYLFPPKWIPDPVRWQNYRDAVTAIPFVRYFFNTLLITVLSIVGKVFSVTLVAFAFSRLRWWGRDTLFLVMLSTLMLPPHITLIPLGCRDATNWEGRATWHGRRRQWLGGMNGEQVAQAIKSAGDPLLKG